MTTTVLSDIFGISRGSISKINGIEFGNILSCVEVRVIPPAWHTDISLNVVRMQHKACGTHDATLVFGGNEYDIGWIYILQCEEFNGTSWTNGGSFTARDTPAAAGTQTAALSAGGKHNGVESDLADTDEYNGTAWSSSGDLNTGRSMVDGCGSQTAAIVIGGSNHYDSEEYNGTAWTVGETAPIRFRQCQVTGVQDSLVLSGGYYTRTATYTFNGSTFTVENDIIARRLNHSSGSSSGGSSALIFGGQDGFLEPTSEEWDGTNWSVRGSLNIPRGEGAGAGNLDSSAMMMGGWLMGIIATTNVETYR